MYVVRGLVLLVLLAACSAPGASALPPASADEASPPLVAASPTPSPSPRMPPPATAGFAPDAGVLYVFAQDDVVYRYDGLTGELRPVSRGSTLLAEDEDGVYVLGRHGGVTLLRWDGTSVRIECGPGRAASVSTTGGCASIGGEGSDMFSLNVRLPGETRARVVLSPDWGATDVEWSLDGSRLLLLRAAPGLTLAERLHNALWIMDLDGRLTKLYEPAARSAFLLRPRWSPDGRAVLVSEQWTPSASLAADGLPLLLVDPTSGNVTSLGVVLRREWARWSDAGRLALVRGSGRFTWDGKQLVLRDREGREELVKHEGTVALAPAWGLRGELAWVSGPSSRDVGAGPDYVNGVGPGARVAKLRRGDAVSEVRCADDRIVEGVRWSADGGAVLLLCRQTGDVAFPLELWLRRLQDGRGADAPLVVSLGSAPLEARGFGYYGAHPSLFSFVAWSRAAR